LSSRPIADADVERLLPFCEQAAVAIENSRLLAERERLLERKRRMMEVAAAINTRLELDKILRMVRDAVVDVGGFDRGGVRVDGEMVGMLSVDNLMTLHPIREENIEMLLHFTEQAAAAIRNARLLDERERHLDRQRRLASLAAAISASVDLNAVLRMVRDAVV